MKSKKKDNVQAFRHLIGKVYELHGGLRGHFGGPTSASGLNLLEALVLGVIVTNFSPPTVPQIGRVLGYSRQAIQRAMNKLIDIGLVRTQRNPDHARASLHVATAKGTALMTIIQKPARELAEAVAADFSSARITRITRELDALIDSIRARTQGFAAAD